MENPILLHACADTENPKLKGLHNKNRAIFLKEFFSTPIAYSFISLSLKLYYMNIPEPDRQE
jgi:hypothetical protein